MVQNENDEVKIREKKVTTQRLDSDGNISLVPMNKMCLYVVGEETLINGKLKKLYTRVSNDYLYLEWIDDDTYIFGELSCDPLKINHSESYDEIDADIKYGILKIKRNEDGYAIQNGEEIIVQAIYDKISQNNDKTVTVCFNGDYAYFDYEKGMQLTPVVLKHAVSFSTEYDGFAECSTQDKFGYLPRDVEPVTKEENIKLLTEEQVKTLTKYQEVIDNICYTNKVYKEITGHSYSKRKKYD